MKYLLFFCLFQFVLILNVNSCIKNNVQEGPVCEIVDIVRLFDDDAPASFDCVKDYDNSIHLKHGKVLYNFKIQENTRKLIENLLLFY